MTDLPYRDNVGAVLFNRDGLVLVARRAGLGAAVLHDTNLELVEALETGAKGCGSLIRHFRAVADVLALAAVDHEGDNALQRITLLFQQNGIEQRKRNGDGGGKAQKRAALAQHEADQNQQRDRHQDQRQRGQRKERLEADGPIHLTAPAVRGVPARGPGPTCSCRSTYTS